MIKTLRIAVLLMAILVIIGGIIILRPVKEKPVEPAQPPVIELTGDQQIELEQGEEYLEPGYSATDAEGNDLTDQVDVEVPSMDENGTYEVKYSVEDEEGNTATASRTVIKQWSTQTKEGKERGIRILAYHDVYDGLHPPAGHGDDQVANQVLRDQMQYLVDQGYSFPTWEEVYQYLSGMIDLPEKSIVVTFDGGGEGFRTWGAPILEELDVKATVFCATEEDASEAEKAGYQHIEVRSAEKKGEPAVYAYPDGTADDSAKDDAKADGYKMALTLDDGKAFPDGDLFEVKRQYIRGNMTFWSYSRMIDGLTDE